MSVKVRAKNPSNILQTLSCDSNGQLNVAFDGLDLSTTNSKLDELKTLNTKSIQHISLLNHTIAPNSVGSVIDLSTYKTLGSTLWGNSDTHHNLVLQYSEDNTTYFNIKNVNVVNIENDLTFYDFLEIPPRYIRFLNPKNTNVSVNIHLDLIV